MSLKDNIKKQGWTMEQLAAELTDKNGNKGVTQATVSQIITGNPTLRKLQEIAKIIGVPLSVLLAEDDAGANFVCPHCGKPIKINVE